MKIGVRSFFIDYYDYQFESPYFADVVWFRRCDVPPFKREAFELMRSKGIQTPEFGTKKELIERGMPLDTKVVAYYDPTGHATHGKYLTTLKDVWYDNMELSEYIQTDYPISTRVLYVGKRSFCYTMWSNDDWRSNTGSDIQMQFVNKDCHFRFFEKVPLYAIDYVKGYAVDFNYAPGIGKTPIEEHLPSQQVYSLFQEWVDMFGPDVLECRTE